MILAIDFDGTIVEHKWFDKSDPTIGNEIPNATSTLKKLKAEGHKLVLWTGRSGYPLYNAVRWCANRDITFDGVNENVVDTTQWGCVPKIYADIYIDDKSIACLMREVLGNEGIDWLNIHEWVNMINDKRNNEKISEEDKKDIKKEG